MRFNATTRSVALGVTLGLACMVSMAGTATAEPSLYLDVDDAKVVKIAGTPATVVVSNPLFADASVQGNKLILVGKNTGRTKVIVLDFDGKQLVNMQVNVNRDEREVVSVYRAGSRTSLTCDPFCDRQLIVNDDPTDFAQQSDQIKLKTEFSNGASDQGEEDPAGN